MSKRFPKNLVSSPAKRLKLDVTRERESPAAVRERRSLSKNINENVQQNHVEDLWGDDFGEEEIEEMDFIASQATQEETVFIAPKPVKASNNHPFTDFGPSTSSGPSSSYVLNSFNHKTSSSDSNVQSQVLGSSDIHKEILESTQAIMFDDFESNVKGNSLTSTFRSRQDVASNNIVLISDDDHVDKWKEEKKKLLDDFLTKEGETEFLRQQLNQIQTRAENAKKEQARVMDQQMQKLRGEINNLIREKTALESQLQLQVL